MINLASNSLVLIQSSIHASLGSQKFERYPFSKSVLLISSPGQGLPVHLLKSARSRELHPFRQFDLPRFALFKVFVLMRFWAEVHVHITLIDETTNHLTHYADRIRHRPDRKLLVGQFLNSFPSSDISAVKYQACRHPGQKPTPPQSS